MEQGGAGVELRNEIKRTRRKSKNQTAENFFDPSLHWGGGGGGLARGYVGGGLRGGGGR
jgi:hypothetical protein